MLCVTKTENVSLFNIFVALLSAYLYRLTGNKRLATGTAFHNRRSKEFKETIGLFMEVHPLHIEIAEGETFASLAKKVAADAAGVINKESGALQLRFLQTLTEIATEKNSTIIFPVPLDLLKPFIDMDGKK